MRFVESCATCRHLVEDDGRTSGVKCEKHVVPTSMCLTCNDYNGEGTARLLFNRGRVPVVATPAMHWVACPSCGWEGWDTQLVMHILSAGGEEIVTEVCPKCAGEVKL